MSATNMYTSNANQAHERGGPEEEGVEIRRKEGEGYLYETRKSVCVVS